MKTGREDQTRPDDIYLIYFLINNELMFYQFSGHPFTQAD